MVREHWRSDMDATGIVWLCIDKADGSANVLSEPVLRELDEIIEPYRENPPRGLVIYSGKRNGFVMGADINEFVKIDTPEGAYDLIRRGQQVLEKLEALRCPTVAVINGFALGGGLELALACDHRLVLQSDKPILGLPEVQLGIHPGFGGTVRSTRICGVRAAMQLMLSGKSITPAKARQLNLIDRIAAPDNWKQAAREMIASARPPARASLADRVLNLGPIRPFVARKLRKEIAARARPEHYPAPYALIDLWSRHGASPKSGYEAEARSIAKLMCSDTSRNLVRVFFLQNRLKSQGNKSEVAVKRLHVVGAGVMGGDIAAWSALKGFDVSLQDRSEEYVLPAITRGRKLFGKKLRDKTERKKASERLRADAGGQGIADADLIIEAIVEDPQAKRALYERIQGQMKLGALLATNTSSIRLEALRTVLDQPQRFVGLHFFNPVAKLPLVEVVHCEDTPPEVLDLALAFVKAIGKFPLECRSSPGFLVNRVLGPYMAEALHLAEAGVALTQIDRAAEEFGMPMGPIELLDTVGIDVACSVSRVLGEAFGKPLPPQLDGMVERAELGRKTGKGFYLWKDGKAVKSPKTEEEAAVPLKDLQDRLILPLINEAVACLRERVVADADLLDAGVIFGTGFAPFRGGPLKYARDRGVADIKSSLDRLESRYGSRFKADVGWSAL